jgi:hypothetical protein
VAEALRFHKSIYREAALRRAVDRFAAIGGEAGAIGRFEVIEAEADWLVAVIPTREATRERLEDELRNHVLHETILERKGVVAAGGAA